jgi:hypothetical protein
MKNKVPLIFAIICAILHLLLVAVVPLVFGYRGEEQLYIVLLDLPLFRLAEIVAPRLLYNSGIFNFILIYVLGTVMYAFVGFIIGLFFQGNAGEEEKKHF